MIGCGIQCRGKIRMTKTIRIGICDDSDYERECLSRYILQYFKSSSYEPELLEYDSGEGFLQNRDADILFLDIEMAELDGIEVKEKLQKEKSKTRIIFITSHSECMAKAFGERVIGFLQKPIEYTEMKEKLEIALKMMDDGYSIIIKGTDKEIVLDTKQILYIKADGKYSDLILETGENIFSDKGIGMWREELNTREFFLCHKSYLVNLYHIQQIGNGIQLSGGIQIPVSKRLKGTLKENYRDYIRQQVS